MTPEDERHGTNKGYNAGCRCDGCKEGHAQYRAEWRKRVYLNRGLVKRHAIGTQRRIQALAAIGWSLQEIDRRVERSLGFTARVLRQDEVTQPIAAMYARLYDELSMTVPEGPYIPRDRRRAARKGWLPPLMWDDDRIDDPTYEPMGALYRVNHGQSYDEVIVLRALAGDRVGRTTQPERLEIMRRWLAAGRSEREMCVRMGWREGRYTPRNVERVGQSDDAERRAS